MTEDEDHVTMTEVTAVARTSFPATCDAVWAALADTPRMVAIDPLLDAYEPEQGTIQQGTENRVTARLARCTSGPRMPSSPPREAAATGSRSLP